MDDLSFTTFLKLTLLPTTQGRFGALQRMINSSKGYDFYKQMKFAAKGVARGETDPDEILSKLSEIKNPIEREHNTKMAKNFLEWWTTQVGASALTSRPTGIYKAEAMHFGIKLLPELAYKLDEQIHVIYLWAIRTPLITKQTAGIGLHLLKQKLATGKYSDAKFSILNLRTKTLLSDNLVTNQSAALAQADIAGINELWKSLS